MKFTASLHRAVQQRAGSTATVCNGRRQTYAQLQDRVARLAAGLRGLRIKRNERVAIYGFNSDHFLEALCAVPWMGGVVNPVNFRWSLPEVIYSLNDSQSTTIFLDEHFAQHAKALMDGCPSLLRVLYAGEGACPDGLTGIESLIAANAPMDDVEAGDDDLYGVFYTGGTTGAPKGVLLSHRNICTSALSLLAEGLVKPGAIGLHAAPMFHLADMMLTTCLLMRGGTHVVVGTFKPDGVLALVQEHQITDLLLVPAMLQALVDHPTATTEHFTAVRNVFYGASPASEALLKRAMAKMPHVEYSQVYGMTELAATATCLPPEQHRRADDGYHRLRSAGRALSHVRVRIVGNDGRELPPSEVGEIAVSGPNVMLGYLNKPEATAACLKQGWMMTGDAGYMDAEGYVFIVDRLKDMIISGGENVYCAEVENVVSKHAAVAACAVIGIPSAEWGESVHAVVVLKPGAALTAEELHAHCKTYIAGYKCPRTLEVRSSLPISGAGKVLKTELRAPYWQGRTRAVN